MIKDMMTDTETYGKTAGCAIRSIGAAMFDRETGQIGATFYANIDNKSCEELGLHCDSDTVAWWQRQSKESQEQLLVNPLPIGIVMFNFIQWCKEQRVAEVWCQGMDFDFPIIQAVLDKTYMEAPWKFWNKRDTRTIYDVCGFNPKSIPRQGTYHNALDDCFYQIECVHQALKKVRRI